VAQSNPSLPALRAHIARYARALWQTPAHQDSIARLVFARQLDATTSAWRALVPLAIVFVAAGIAAVWGSINRPGAIAGALLIIGTAIWGWRVIPVRTAEHDLHEVARCHRIVATLIGSGWAVLCVAMSVHAGRELVFLVAVLQMALMAVGLIMYVNHPAGFVGFTTPVALSLAITSIPVTIGGPAVSLPLILVYYGILAKAAVDQSTVFADAQTSASRLAESEAARLQLARESAEAQARQAAEIRASEAEQSIAAARQAEQLKRESLLQLGEQFEQHVAAAVNLLSEAVAELDRSASQLAAIGEGSAGAAADVAQRAVAASSSALFVATAAEELAQSVGEIAHHVDGHAALSDAARMLASTSSQRIDAIREEAAKIDSVIELVDGVASQTKLLALNATIEAARAGDVGRGFAVVASEVKALASRTSTATADVREQTGSIVGQIATASARMTETAGKIDEVAAIASFIAASVTQQRRATLEIGQETNQVATHIDDVRERAEELASGARITGSLARAMNETVAGISRQADTLRAETAGFLQRIRAA
jgi:methyl-accepting chemotaxis protein